MNTAVIEVDALVRYAAGDFSPRFEIPSGGK